MDPIFREPRQNDKSTPAKPARVQPSELTGTNWGKGLLNLFGEVDGKPRFQTWPERLVKSFVEDSYDAVKFSGDVLQGKADPSDPANFKHVMNMALMAVTVGWKPVKAAYPGITEEQIKALDAYTASAYAQLNRYLENRLPYQVSKEQEKFLKQTADRLDALIKNSPVVDRDVTVFRGLPAQSVVARYPNMDPGDILRFDAFTSTSFSGQTARSFAGGNEGIVLQIKVPKGTKALDVEKTYEGIGVLGGGFEKEMILPRGLEYKITKLDKEGRVIHLEVVPPGKKAEGFRLEALPPKKEAPTTPYMQDVNKLLADLEKSPSYIKNTSVSDAEHLSKLPQSIQEMYTIDVMQNGWSGSLNEYLKQTGNAKYMSTKSPVSATPTLETLKAKKNSLVETINKTTFGSKKWDSLFDEIEKINSQLNVLKTKGQKAFEELLTTGNAL